MPQRTAAELQEQINTLLADNDEGLISEADVRSVLTDIKDSMAFAADVDDGGGVDLAETEIFLAAVDGTGSEAVDTFDAAASMVNLRHRTTLQHPRVGIRIPDGRTLVAVYAARGDELAAEWTQDGQDPRRWVRNAYRGPSLVNIDVRTRPSA